MKMAKKFALVVVASAFVAGSLGGCKEESKAPEAPKAPDAKAPEAPKAPEGK